MVRGHGRLCAASCRGTPAAAARLPGDRQVVPRHGRRRARLDADALGRDGDRARARRHRPDARGSERAPPPPRPARPHRGRRARGRRRPGARAQGARRRLPARPRRGRLRVEPAAERHVPGIAAIYGHEALTSAATFDLVAPPEEEWLRQLAGLDPERGHHLLVAVDGDEVLGYAKSGTHRSRPAYDTTCETSVYVARTAQGRGVGGALYDELLHLLEASPLRLAVAGMTEPNEASRRLHESRGFTFVGRFNGIGTKFGRSWDVAWFQRGLGDAP